MESTRQFGIKAMNPDDRPREKLMLKGKESLTNAELMATLIATGTKDKTAVEVAQLILDDKENRLPDLARMSVKDLMKHKGIGEAKAITIVAALELGTRRRYQEVSRNKVKTSVDIFNLLSGRLGDLNHEEFWIVLLNRANFIIGTKQIGKGGMSGTIADPKLIFRAALEGNAASFVAVHNHPSGNVQPSEADRNITDKLKNSGKMMDLPLLDHVIIGDGAYFSFADEGLI